MSGETPLPGQTSTALPDRYRNHSRLQAAPFFTLPRELLDAVVQAVGGQRFDANLLQMERNLADVIGSTTVNVGYWRQLPIEYPLLRHSPPPYSDDQIADLALVWRQGPAQVRRILETAGQRFEWANSIRRGFCGWLMTNRTFLEEQDALLGKWGDEVQRSGIPAMGRVVVDAAGLPRVSARVTGAEADFVRQMEEFCVRWRLQGLVAPGAPIPLMIQLPAVELGSLLAHMRRGGITFYLPDIFPIPSRDEFRRILEEAMRRPATEAHLAPWMRLVRSSNAARNQIRRWARIFQIQHYLRALYARHAAALRRQQGTLFRILADFLNVSEDMVEQDVRRIADRLGRNWFLPRS